MVLSNAQIAQMFEELADLLAIEGADPFKIRAYRNAARTISGLARSLQSMVEEGADLTELPGIGEHIAAKIEEIVRTGRLRKLEQLKKHFPPHLTDLLHIEGIGPKRARILYEQLGITTLDQLKAAAEAHRIRTLPGFSTQLEEKILHATLLAKKAGRRFLYTEAEPHAAALERYLEACPHVERVVIAGSFRRRRETVGDLDIVTTSRHPEEVIGCFVRYPDTREVIAQGTTRSTILLHSDIQVDLRCVPPESFGATLHYFTGSKAHNIAIRIEQKARGRKVNEYGIFEGDERIAGATEEEFYAAAGLRYIEPELRERRGELRAAREGTLPDLVTREELRGDLHVHTRWSDGTETIEAMAEAARRLGHEYLAITDHSRHMPIVHGLDVSRLEEQIDAIDRIDRTLERITLLKGIEVDILVDGTLALPDTILSRLDLVVAAVHDHFDLPPSQQSARILKALDNPLVNILAHPTGRLIGRRQPCRLPWKSWLEEVHRRGVILEINAQPSRLDLDDIHIKRAKEAGIRFAISTDAHTADSLDYLRYGVYQARRGWLEKGDVINTLPLEKLRQALRRS